MSHRAHDQSSSHEISLRPVSANNTEFLMQVYASTRQEELAIWGWSPAQQASFVRMQFHVRQRGYAAAYPSADTSVVCVGDVPVGSTVVFRGTTEMRLVDISLLPEFRSRGIGGELIRILISEAGDSRRALRLCVLRSNRAARLYERLGFAATGGDPMYCEMEFVGAHAPSRTNAASLSLEEDSSHAGKAE